MSGHKNDVAATSTVATIRSTECIKLFTQKATAAVAAGSAYYKYLCFVYETHTESYSVAGGRSLGLCLCCHHADEPTVVASVIPNVSIDGCEDGPVPAYTDAIAWVKFGSELTNNDVSCCHELAIASLNATVLWSRVASVS
jgi:hypothetical protein